VAAVSSLIWNFVLQLNRYHVAHSEGHYGAWEAVEQYETAVVVHGRSINRCMLGVQKMDGRSASLL
jgi:hypothetical protein